jgi:drug/metabolite transporter (DMT)-like permease
MSSDQRKYWTLGLLLAIGGVLCFSLRPILIKLAYAWSQDPITLLALRMAFAAPFFAGVAIWSGRRGSVDPLSTRDLWYVVLLGLLSYYAASFLDFLALQYISAGLGRLVLFLYPTIVVLLSAVFLARPITARELIALVLTYAGLALVLLHSFNGNRDVLYGAALAMASSVCYAVYLVAGSQVIARVGSMRFSAYAMVAATVACLLQFVVLRPFSALDVPVQVLGYAATMAIVSTVIPVFLTAEALRRVGANTVAIVGALGPVSTIALGWIGLEEAMTPLQMGGVGLVLAGVLAVSVRPRPSTPIEPSAAAD